MKYVPRPVEEEADNQNENVSKDSGFSYGARVIFNVILAGLAIYLVLGLIVDFAVPYIPASWEDAIAEPIMAEIASEKKSAGGYSVEEIQRLLDSLAGLIKDNQRKFRVSVYAEEEVNALALPGGYIVVYSKLLDQVESENELAMILAHELGHFVARDHLRGLGRSFLFFAVSTIFLGGDNASTRMLMNSSGILQNNYSRTQEYAADSFALGLLVKKYGHAGGAVDFFKRLAVKETLPNLMHYMSTHPASEKRVRAINDIIAAGGIKSAEVRPVFWRTKPVEAEKTGQD